MDLTPSLPSSLAETAGPQPTNHAAAMRAEPDIRAAIQRVLDEATSSAGKPIGPDDLLAHLLREPGPLSRDALAATGVTPERLRAELLRLAGHPEDAQEDGTPKDRAPWPLSRWAWILVMVSSIAYPLSVGPVLLMMERLDLERTLEGPVEVVYLPIIWLYGAVPWVEAFYDWYLKAIGCS